MTTPQTLLAKIGEELGTQWTAHPSVPWYNRKTGQNYILDAYFCASGLSRAFDAIGMGSAVGGPWIWTVGWYNWCLENLTQVSAANAQPGDIAFWKFGASGDRGTAPVNHVNAVRDSGATWFRGYNEVSGGTGGWVTDVAYSHANLVAIFRPKWPGKTNTSASIPAFAGGGDNKMFMLALKNGRGDGKTIYAITGPGYWFEFTDLTRASNLNKQLAGAHNSPSLHLEGRDGLAFWNAAQKAAKTGYGRI